MLKKYVKWCSFIETKEQYRTSQFIALY